MNLKELKELIALFEEAEVTELEIEREGVKIRLKKGNDKSAKPKKALKKKEADVLAEEKVETDDTETVKEVDAKEDE